MTGAASKEPAVKPGTVVWFTGLPASGKSRLARHVAAHLRLNGVPHCTLDSDEIRAALVPAPGYDDAGRADFYATLANLAASFSQQGLVVLVPATAARRVFRERARRAVSRFIEVYLDVPAEVCQSRDPKQLYAQAKQGDIQGMPGVDATYEVPAAPEVRASGGDDEQALRQILDALR